MELALPLIAFGGMYILSNQSAKNTENTRRQMHTGNTENFANMRLEPNNNLVPNSNPIPTNFPVEPLNQLKDTIQAYPNPNTATDRYFNQNVYQQSERQGVDVGSTIQQIYSLSGNYLNSDQFKHNNMVPFNGGKVKGRAYDIQIAETVLDNMVGSGSQTIKKVEQAPLFKPEDNVQWTYGAPNQSDFFQSRVNPSMRNNNVKPFESVTVGPGLNQGYETNGSGGFNSGMEARDLWLPKTVDELRVETNPKLEYELLGHEGPAISSIKTPSTTQMIGRVEKNRPDTFYINTQDRWFTTTGASKGETLRAIQETGIVRRNNELIDYTGPAGAQDVHASYAPENFEPSKRNEVIEGGVNHSKATGKGGIEDGENYLRSHTNYSNHRSTVKQPDTIRSGFSGAIGAVVAPLMDFLKPTRKEETMNNVRIYGDGGTTVPKGYVYNPLDATPTTVKETTLYAPKFNINNQKEGLYVNNYSSPDATQRDTTSCQYYSAPGGYATAYGDRSYESAYRQHNNDIKSQTINNRPNQGGTQLFNQQMHLSTIKADTTRYDGRMGGAYDKTGALPPSIQTYGTIHTPQKYNEAINCERMNPNILDAFKNNPYTHSLSSVA